MVIGLGCHPSPLKECKRLNLSAMTSLAVLPFSQTVEDAWSAHTFRFRATQTAVRVHRARWHGRIEPDHPGKRPMRQIPQWPLPRPFEWHWIAPHARHAASLQGLPLKECRPQRGQEEGSLESLPNAVAMVTSGGLLPLHLTAIADGLSLDAEAIRVLLEALLALGLERLVRIHPGAVVGSPHRMPE